MWIRSSGSDLFLCLSRLSSDDYPGSKLYRSKGIVEPIPDFDGSVPVLCFRGRPLQIYDDRLKEQVVVLDHTYA